MRRGWNFSATYGLASATSSTNWWTVDAAYKSGSSTSGTVTGISDYVTINPGFDPQLHSPAGLALRAYSSTATYGYRKLVVRMKSSTSCSNQMAQLFWKRTTDSQFTEANSKAVTISGSTWQNVTFDMSASAGWTGTIHQLRLDPAAQCSTSTSVNDDISIAYAYFTR